MVKMCGMRCDAGCSEVNYCDCSYKRIACESCKHSGFDGYAYLCNVEHTVDGVTCSGYEQDK